MGIWVWLTRHTGSVWLQWPADAEWDVAAGPDQLGGARVQDGLTATPGARPTRTADGDTTEGRQAALPRIQHPAPPLLGPLLAPLPGTLAGKKPSHPRTFSFSSFLEFP